MRAPSALVLTAALVLALTVLCTAVFAQSRPQPAYVLITHPGTQVGSVDRKFVEDAFLKKVTRWPDGNVIRPVDLPPDSSVRQKFTEELLNRTVAAVKGYWQQRIFSGRDVPPPEVASDDDAIRYVLKHDGAIAYVSPGASFNGARVVTVK